MKEGGREKGREEGREGGKRGIRMSETVCKGGVLTPLTQPPRVQDISLEEN